MQEDKKRLERSDNNKYATSKKKTMPHHKFAS